jgi:hypothetical protein
VALCTVIPYTGPVFGLCPCDNGVSSFLSVLPADGADCTETCRGIRIVTECVKLTCTFFENKDVS